MPKRSSHVKKTNRRKKGRPDFLKWIIFVLVVSFILLALVFLRTKYWNSDGKSAVVKAMGKDVVITLYDSKSDNLTDIVIPGNTQVLTTHGLGTWKLESLWKLGEDEKIGGSLITKTISKNFGFPVFVWWDRLSTGDRLRTMLFSLFNKSDKETILLQETGFLKKTVFLDGEKGYSVNKDHPEEILSLFSDQDEFGENLKAKINDSTNIYGLSEKVGRIIETMGIKVAAISKGSVMDANCKVVGGNKKLVKKVALIFDCRETQIKEDNPFDLEIYLGEKFAQEF